MTATAAERRAARAEARREEILDAAQRIFATKGYNETGIADIAADLGIGHGTFYRYFENKQDIAVQVLDRAILDIASALSDEDPHASNDVDEYRAQTTRIMLRMFEKLESHPEAFTLLHVQSVAIDTTATQRSFEAYSAYTEVFLRNGIEKGFLRAGHGRRDHGAGAGRTDLRGHAPGDRRGHAARDLWMRWINAGVALMFEGVSGR